MKICSDCEYSKKEAVNTNMGPQMMMICFHQECRDPVEGDQIPCNVARRELVFCSIKGNYFEPKKDIEDAQIISLVQT